MVNNSYKQSRVLNQVITNLSLILKRKQVKKNKNLVFLNPNSYNNNNNNNNNITTTKFIAISIFGSLDGVGYKKTLRSMLVNQ